MSTRSRLTFSYGALLLATMVAFAVALWSARQNEGTDELVAETHSEAEVVATAIRQAQFAGGQLTMADNARPKPVARATELLIKVLGDFPGYFVVFNNQDTVLFASASIRNLSKADQNTLISAALQLSPGVEIAKASVRNDSLRLFMLSDKIGTLTASVPNISRVVMAIPVGFAAMPAHLLVGTLIILAPIVFLASMVVAYLVVGNAFRPVDQLINEVEAITDGRSLHRRLPADSSNDELSRLGLTVNAMLSRLETSFAALRRFTADASHELKTPLTVLRVDVERAMHPSTNRADRMVALEEALQETARMSDLVDSLLTLARADEGRFDIHRTPVEIEPLMREVYETAVILGEHAGLALSMPAPESAVVMGDRTRLRQLLLNLVTNAIKYTPRGGRVDVSATRRPNDEIAIVVRDTGIGIAASELPHVFDRFWRADRARSRASERGGFGLGLSISQWIVQAHGGTLVAQSRLGRGSVFTVVLPVVPEAPAPSEPLVDAAESAE